MARMSAFIQESKDLMRHEPHHQPRIVVITGASAGVGRATVREFARERAWIGLVVL